MFLDSEYHDTVEHLLQCDWTTEFQTEHSTCYTIHNLLEYLWIQHVMVVVFLHSYAGFPLVDSVAETSNIFFQFSSVATFVECFQEYIHHLQ